MAALTSSTIPKHIYHLPLSLRCRISLNGGTSASLLSLISSLALTKCLQGADLTDGYQSAAEIHQPNGLLTGVILTSIYIVFLSGGGSVGAPRCDGPDRNCWNISFHWAETALHGLNGRSWSLFWLFEVRFASRSQLSNFFSHRKSNGTPKRRWVF